MIGLQIRPAVWPAFTFESNGSGGRGESRPMRAVRGGGLRHAGWCGRGRHDLRVFGQLEPLPVTRLGRGIVTQRTLGAGRQAKLAADRGAGFPESLKSLEGRDRMAEFVEIVASVPFHHVRAQGRAVENRLGVDPQQRRVVGLVEEGCAFFDPSNKPPGPLIALSYSARWGPRSGRRYFGRGCDTHDFAAGASAFCWRRASRFSRLAARFSLRKASRCLCARFIFPIVERARAV